MSEDSKLLFGKDHESYNQTEDSMLSLWEDFFSPAFYYCKLDDKVYHTVIEVQGTWRWNTAHDVHWTGDYSTHDRSWDVGEWRLYDPKNRDNFEDSVPKGSELYKRLEQKLKDDY